MCLEVKMLELVPNNTEDEKLFIEESKNIDIPSNYQKRKYDSITPLRSRQKSTLNDICNGTPRHTLYFRSPIAFRPKCCAEEDNKNDKIVETGVKSHKSFCKMSSNCSSNTSCNGHELLFRSIRSTLLYQGVNEALVNFLSNEDYTKTEKGVAEMYTLLLLVLCND